MIRKHIAVLSLTLRKTAEKLLEISKSCTKPDGKPISVKILKFLYLIYAENWWKL